MKTFLSEIHFENQWSSIHIAVVAKTLAEAKKKAKIAISKSKYKNDTIVEEIWKKSSRELVMMTEDDT